jgi:hypothetical protein
MGPREALAQIVSIIKLAKATHDPSEVQRLLAEMETLAETAVGRRTLRQARMLQTRRLQ